MSRSRFTRREFDRLTSAALGGLLAAGLPGCSPAPSPPPGGPPPVPGETGAAGQDTPATEAPAEGVALLLAEPHVCRGLNTCKGKGAGGDNACAGQGACATATHHECAGQNDCKGQGGCGYQQGINACKGMGGCAVPLKHGWDEVRKKFEEAMKAAGKEVGPAPEAA